MVFAYSGSVALGVDCGQVSGLVVVGDQTIPSLLGDFLQQCSLRCPGVGKEKRGGWIHPGMGYLFRVSGIGQWDEEKECVHENNFEG